ncbi:MAG TPA: phosphatase PAP2 family protein [Nitrospirota bacterium]|nr:phosphatase PAP2 family protein [Nitrospirota bacterium]
MKRALNTFMLVCLLSACSTVTAWAQAEKPDAVADRPSQEVSENKDPQSEDAVELNKEYFKGYVSDLKNIVTSPARWDATDWITAVAVTGIAAGLYDNDAKIQKWVLDHRTTTTDNIGDNATLVGHGALTAPIVGGMYLYGYLADDGKMRKTSLLSVESFVLTGVFVQTLKRATGRHRPDTGDPPHTWDGPRIHTPGSHMSFPTGHGSSAFAIATVIASEYDNIVIPTIAYSVAGITALNRISHNAHWASDTFVGSAIGYFTGKAVVASHRGGEGRLSLAPMNIGDNVGMGVTYKF